MQLGRKPRRGDVVLTPFPFADLQTTKVRPALIVSGTTYQANEPDLIVAAMTSNITANRGPTDYAVGDWQQAGLDVPSVVKASLATIEPNLIRHRIGRLTDHDLNEVAKRLRLALEL